MQATPLAVSGESSRTNVQPRPIRFRLSALTAALAAGGLLTFGSAHATFIFDGTHEPTNDTRAGATSGLTGDTFSGCVGPFCDVAHGGAGNTDPEDFVNFGS